jgi:hypothetical protein
MMSQGSPSFWIASMLLLSEMERYVSFQLHLDIPWEYSYLTWTVGHPGVNGSSKKLSCMDAVI